MKAKKVSDQQKIVAVVGLGYVGMPLAVLSAAKGYRVIGIDVNEEKVELINKKQLPYKDDKLQHELRKVAIRATTDFHTISEAEIIVVCVPTPVREDHSPDLGPVISAAQSVGAHLKKGQLIILESTVSPSVTEDIFGRELESASGLKLGKDFTVAHCPERINPGDDKWPLERIPRVVGALDKKGLTRALQFYRSILQSEVTSMPSLREAEAVKLVENAFRDINIAFVNELAMSFSRFGIDVVEVLHGASTKPFGFMPHFPGCGVGGHCIPVDPYYLIDYGHENGYKYELLKLTRSVNQTMPRFTAGLALKALKHEGVSPKKATIAVLGLAYKADIDDVRESPSFEIIEHLEQSGAKVKSFDPLAMRYGNMTSLEEAVKDVDAVIIATAHKEFRMLRPRFFKQRGIKVIVDGRNCLSKEEFKKSGLIYQGIGR